MSVKRIFSQSTGRTGDHKTSIWLEDFLFPAYEKAILKAIVTIQSADAMARLSSRLWNRAGSKFSFEAINTLTLDGAYEYIQQKTTSLQ